VGIRKYKPCYLLIATPINNFTICGGLSPFPGASLAKRNLCLLNPVFVICNDAADYFFQFIPEGFFENGFISLDLENDLDKEWYVLAIVNKISGLRPCDI